MIVKIFQSILKFEKQTCIFKKDTVYLILSSGVFTRINKLHKMGVRNNENV